MTCRKSNLLLLQKLYNPGQHFILIEKVCAMGSVFQDPKLCFYPFFQKLIIKNL